jgi:hypothetical protein
MLVTRLEGLKYSDRNLAWGRLPGSITQLAAKCQKINASSAPDESEKLTGSSGRY